MFCTCGISHCSCVVAGGCQLWMNTLLPSHVHNALCCPQQDLETVWGVFRHCWFAKSQSRYGGNESTPVCALYPCLCATSCRRLCRWTRYLLSRCGQSLGRVWPHSCRSSWQRWDGNVSGYRLWLVLASLKVPKLANAAHAGTQGAECAGSGPGGTSVGLQRPQGCRRGFWLAHRLDACRLAHSKGLR